MTIRKENNYIFYTALETRDILFINIEKFGEYTWTKEKQREKKINWYYKSSDFLKNPALIFSKLIPHALDKDDDENKHKYLEIVIAEMSKLNTMIKNGELNYLQQYKSTIEKLKLTGLHLNSFESTLSWRMVIGLGAAHPQETSMTLHHIYGIPYIPGSAIKGVTRHWAILKEFDKLGLPIEQINCFEKILENADLNDKQPMEKFERKFKVKVKDKEIKPDKKLFNFLKEQQELIKSFQGIFGTQNHIGKVIFFDAYPLDEIKLKIDVMTPHYGDYYSGKTPPADWQSPNPIKFLTVENTRFKFYLASKSKNSKLLNEACALLREALKNYGIGAKTSLGYGFLKPERSSLQT